MDHVNAILRVRWRERRMMLVGKSLKILLWACVVGQGFSRHAPGDGEWGSCGVVLSNQNQNPNQIKSNQIKSEKRCLMICKLQRGSCCLHPNFGPLPAPVFSTIICPSFLLGLLLFSTVMHKFLLNFLVIF